VFHHNVEIDARDKQIFCFSLGQAVQEGMPIILALQQAAELVPGQRMKEACQFIERGILDGETLVVYPQLITKFPELDDGLFIPEIGWGEEIGDLDTQLLDLGKRYQQQLTNEPIHSLAESQSVSTFSRLFVRSGNAGLPLGSSLRTAATYLAQKRLPLMAAMIEEIQREFKNGCSLGECLAARPETFPKDYADFLAKAEADCRLFSALDLLIETR